MNIKAMYLMAATVFVAFIVLFPALAYPGGYVRPVEDVPPVYITYKTKSFNWSGAYTGVSLGKVRTKEERTFVNKHEESITKKELVNLIGKSGSCEGFNNSYVSVTNNTYYCDDLLRYYSDFSDEEKEGWTDVIPLGSSDSDEYYSESFKTTDNNYGIFAGYRYQWSNKIVTGVEASYGKHNQTIMVQAGYAFDKVLPYVQAGYEFEDESFAYGVGVDVAITNHVITGISYIKSDDKDQIDVRIGWKF